MRLSAFNVYVDDLPLPGEVLVYNSFSGALAVFDRASFDALRRADAAGSIDASVPGFHPDAVGEGAGIFVVEHDAEEGAFRSWAGGQRASAAELTALVAVNFACNLACTYCCQAEVLDGRSMSEPTVEATARWLVEEAVAAGAVRMRLRITGGEPLLTPRIVERLVDAVRRRAADAEREVRFGIITNGVLLTPELVERWLPLGLDRVQVTLDGDAATHDASRASRRGAPTFETVFWNAREVADRVRVSVVGNFQEETAPGFVRLLARMREAGFPVGTTVLFRPALPDAGEAHPPATSGCAFGAASPSTTIALADEVLRAGFDPGDLLVLGPCGVQLRHHHAIDPDGRIYLCEGFLGRSGWAVGHVATGLGPRHVELSARACAVVDEGCEGCAHRPGCFGGCLASAWLAARAPSAVSCERPWFEGEKRALVARKYLLASADDRDAALAALPPLPPELVTRPGGHRAPGLTLLAGGRARRTP